MFDLYVNMCKLDYWSLKLALDTVVTYHITGKKCESLMVYQAHEVIYCNAVEKVFNASIRSDGTLIDRAEYYEYPKFDDGTPDLSPSDDLINHLDFGLSGILPKKFIAWCLKNTIPVPAEFECFCKGIDPGNALVPDLISTILSENAAAPHPTSDHKYCFIKKGQLWSIQFGDAIIGVKHLTGMDYIKVLLQNPYEEIGVFDLQAMMNPDNILSHREQNINAAVFNFSEDDDSETKTNETDDFNKAVEKLSVEDREKVSMYKKQIKIHEDELNDAILYKSMDASRLTGLVGMLKEDMYNILYSRNDDPELNSNRKKVYKNIEHARNCIRSVEIA